MAMFTMNSFYERPEDRVLQLAEVNERYQQHYPFTPNYQSYDLVDTNNAVLSNIVLTEEALAKKRREQEILENNKARLKAFNDRYDAAKEAERMAHPNRAAYNDKCKINAQQKVKTRTNNKFVESLLSGKVMLSGNKKTKRIKNPY